MIDPYEEILTTFAQKIHVPIKLDEKGATCISVDQKIQVHIEKGKNEDLFLGCFVSEIPPGKYQETIFLETLKANDEDFMLGRFGYNEKNSTLVLFAYLPLKDLTADKLKHFFLAFSEKAIKWKENINEGRFLHKAGPSPFAIKP